MDSQQFVSSAITIEDYCTQKNAARTTRLDLGGIPSDNLLQWLIDRENQDRQVGYRRLNALVIPA